MLDPELGELAHIAARRGTAPLRVRWAVDLMQSSNARRLLEVGCGGGHALQLLGERFPNATIVGIDRSALQVSAARKRVAALRSKASVTVETISLEEAATQWAANRFDAVLAINVNVFWTEPSYAFPAARALLAHRGTLLLAYESPTVVGCEALVARLMKEAARQAWHIVDSPRVDGSRAAFRLRPDVDDA